MLFLFRVFFFLFWEAERERERKLSFPLLPTEARKARFSCRCPIEILSQKKKWGESERVGREEGAKRGTASEVEGRRRRSSLFTFFVFFFSFSQQHSEFAFSLSFSDARAFTSHAPTSHALSLHTSTRTQAATETAISSAGLDKTTPSTLLSFVVVVEKPFAPASKKTSTLSSRLCALPTSLCPCHLFL